MRHQLSILFITQEDFLAGSTYSVFFLARGLAEKGHKIFVAARENSLLHELTEGTKVVFQPLTLTSRFDFDSIKKIKQLVRQHKIDVINAQSSKDRYVSVFARWIYRLDVKVVHTRRQPSLSIGGPIQNLVYVRGTDKIVAVGNGVKKSLEAGGIPEGHIKVIFNGIPPEKFLDLDNNYTQSLRKKFRIRTNDLVIGCISRRKHHDQLLLSLDHLNRPAMVILVGVDDGEDENLHVLIKNFRLPHKVFFEGHIPSNQAINYLPLFNVNVLCSTTEGLSQSLLEAMYMGIPTVATRASGNTDLIKDGVNGFLFENGNVEELASKISKLANDELLHSKLGMEGKRTVMTSFTIENTLANYEQFFSNLVLGLESSSVRRPLPIELGKNTPQSYSGYP